jgi:beta-galactosidase/beta-glucuronidase
LKRNHIDLVFEGLDGPAKVYLNEKLVVTANNMFREWRADVKSQLKPGTNHLLVVFPSPITEATKVAASDFWHQQTQTPEKSYLRKTAYEYGWDWGPRFVLSGIWRPVKLDLWDEARLSNVHVRQRDQLMKVGDSYRLKVSSPVLARSLHQFRRGRCGSFRQLFRYAAGTIRRNYDQDKSERRSLA